jgi:hypothetical protein
MWLREAPIHIADNLTPAQVRAFRLLDNRSHEESTWDLVLLGLELLDLKDLGMDLELTGFDFSEKSMSYSRVLTEEDWWMRRRLPPRTFSEFSGAGTHQTASLTPPGPWRAMTYGPVVERRAVSNGILI